MLTRRTLTSIVAVTALAVPGLAIAQSADDDPPTEQATTEDATEAATDEANEEPSEEESTPEQEADSLQRRQVQEDEDLQVEQEAEEAEEAEEDEGHGDVISALATCLPSGAELHGTGLTKGSIISQVASTGGYAAAEGDEPMPVTTPDEAEDLCTQVQEEVSAAEEAGDAPDRAKGRPDWAGPKDGEAEEEDVAPSSEGAPGVEESRGGGGPPDHARARGRG